MVDCTFRPCDGINPSLLKLLLSSIGHSTEKVTNSPPHQSHRQTGSSPPDASQNHPALSTLQAQLTMAIWVQREFTSLYLGLSSRRHGGQVSVCASLQYVKPWVYPVHRYCTMYSLSCWDSGDSLRFIGLGDGCHSLTGQPGSHRALAFRASPRVTMQLCPPVHRASLEHPSGCLGENLEDSHKPSRQCSSCVQVTTGKAPSVCSVGERQKKEQTVGIKPLVQPFTHFARRHCNSLEFVLEFGEWSAEDQLFCQHSYKLWRK